METENGIRTRLAQVAIDDLDAVHALYRDTKQFLSDGRTGVAPTLRLAELARRVERTEGLAIRAAQDRGELLSKGRSNQMPNVRYVKDLIRSAGESTRVYKLVDGVHDLVFEEAIEKCRAKGAMSRESVIREIETLLAADNPPPSPTSSEKKVVPTRRGRKTVEHMAIALNALALGVAELNPAEVDKKAMAPMIFQAFEDIGVLRTFLRKVNKNEG